MNFNNDMKILAERCTSLMGLVTYSSTLPVEKQDSYAREIRRAFKEISEAYKAAKISLPGKKQKRFVSAEQLVALKQRLVEARAAKKNVKKSTNKKVAAKKS